MCETPDSQLTSCPKPDASRRKENLHRKKPLFRLQGSAADLIKLAMINVHGHMTGRASTVSETLTPPNGSLVGKCRLLLQIHDELVLEVEESALRDVARMVRHSMENVVKLAGMPAFDGFFAPNTESSFLCHFRAFPPSSPLLVLVRFLASRAQGENSERGSRW